MSAVKAPVKRSRRSSNGRTRSNGHARLNGKRRALPPRKFDPLPNPEFQALPDYTILVTIRKEGSKYVAHPKDFWVAEGHCANIVFVLENAPKNAWLKKVKLEEEVDRRRPWLNPFTLPRGKRVLLITDDNSHGLHQNRKFAYKLEVREGSEPFDVDPVIGNDPPPNP